MSAISTNFNQYFKLQFFKEIEEPKSKPTRIVLDENGKKNISNGSEYNCYFSSSSCKEEKIVFGKGNECFKLLIEWVLKYHHQTQKISKILEKPTLFETTESIYNFMYNHIQYTENLTRVFAPACSWENRSSGIDCKSFSIMASSILLNLGIKHYIRKVFDKGTAHVYIVVPLNQTSGVITNKSKYGIDYYVIDGAAHKNIEFPFQTLLYDINPLEIKKQYVKREFLKVTGILALLVFLGAKAN